MKVAYIIDEKKKNGITVHHISEEQSLTEAAAVMSKFNIGALIVTSDSNEDEYLGILSERDIIHACADGQDLSSTKISKIMNKNMIIITPEDTLEIANIIMNKHHIRHLPVLAESKIIGMITIRDVSKTLSEQKDIKIHYLSDFVGGTYGNSVY
jgi:CBS domain-containing protein